MALSGCATTVCAARPPDTGSQLHPQLRCAAAWVHVGHARPAPVGNHTLSSLPLSNPCKIPADLPTCPPIPPHPARPCSYTVNPTPCNPHPMPQHPPPSCCCLGGLIQCERAPHTGKPAGQGCVCQRPVCAIPGSQEGAVSAAPSTCHHPDPSIQASFCCQRERHMCRTSAGTSLCA